MQAPEKQLDYDIVQHEKETSIHIKVWGTTVFVDRYPKYPEGDYRLTAAIEEAKRTFARKLRTALDSTD